MQLDVLTVAAKLIGCPREEIAFARYNADGSLDAITATGGKHHFAKVAIAAATHALSGDSAASASAANHIPPALATPFPPATERVVTPAARSVRKGRTHK